MLLRDKFWLWGHPEGRFNNAWGNTQKSRMTPMECCLYLGARNTFMVPMDVEVNRRQYNKSFKTLNQVGWECYAAVHDPAAVEPLIQDAKDFPNIGCVVLDDFVRQAGEEKMDVEVGVANLWEIRRRLHDNPVRKLNMWMVLYTHEISEKPEEAESVKKYIEPFDGVIMWNWAEKNAPKIPEKFEIFKKMTPNHRRMFGCYLWNFGENKPATGESVKWQLDWYRERILAGEAEGVVLHTNTMADLDLEAYDAACQWMEEHGDEVIPD